MAKLESTFKNMFLSLSLICLAVAFLLAQVNKMTAKPIAEAKAMKLQLAIGEVVPEFDNDPVAEVFMIPDETGDSLMVYPATKGGELVGVAISSSASGFAGDIQIMVGFDMDNKVGKDMSIGPLAVRNDGGGIDAITASTITSRAFLNAVNRAFAAYNDNRDKLDN